MRVDVINLILLSVCCLSLGYMVEVCHIPCPLDCKLSDWSTWSGCSASCGSRLQMRSKWLREKAFNGGRPCPRLDLKNQASCAAARLLLQHVSLCGVIVFLLFRSATREPAKPLFHCIVSEPYTSPKCTTQSQTQLTSSSIYIVPRRLIYPFPGKQVNEGNSYSCTPHYHMSANTRAVNAKM